MENKYEFSGFATFCGILFSYARFVNDVEETGYVSMNIVDGIFHFYLDIPCVEKGLTTSWERSIAESLRPYYLPFEECKYKCSLECYKGEPFTIEINGIPTILEQPKISVYRIYQALEYEN